MEKDFQIFNYYPTKNIRLSSGLWETTVGYGRIGKVPRAQATQVFAPGTTVDISLSSLQEPDVFHLLAKYKITRESEL